MEAGLPFLMNPIAIKLHFYFIPIFINIFNFYPLYLIYFTTLPFCLFGTNSDD